MGGGHNYASRPHQHHSVICDCPECPRICRMGRVRTEFLLSLCISSWLSRRTKKKDIYVIYTPKRPVPLEHYLYAGRDMHKIVDANGNFLSQGFVISWMLSF